jgi:hypothetical protein
VSVSLKPAATLYQRMNVNAVPGPYSQLEERIGPIERQRFLAIDRIDHKHTPYWRLAIISRDRARKHNGRARVIQMGAMDIVVIEPGLQLACMVHAMNAEQHRRVSPQKSIPQLYPLVAGSQRDL